MPQHTAKCRQAHCAAWLYRLGICHTRQHFLLLQLLMLSALQGQRVSYSSQSMRPFPGALGVIEGGKIRQVQLLEASCDLVACVAQPLGGPLQCAALYSAAVPCTMLTAYCQ